jgi:hypothetical protein
MRQIKCVEQNGGDPEILYDDKIYAVLLNHIHVKLKIP